MPVRAQRAAIEKVLISSMSPPPLSIAITRDRLAAARNFAGSTSGTASSNALRVCVLRAREDRLAAARLDDAAQIHDRDPIADVADHAEIVADEHVGQAELALHRPEQVQDLRLHRDVERRGRLVGQDQRGPQDDGARDRRPLALAARQLVRVAVHEAGAEADQLQRLADQAPPRRLGFRRRAPRAAPASARPIDWRGLNEAVGSWNTTCIRRRSARSSRPPSAAISRPSNRIRPEARAQQAQDQAQQRRFARARLRRRSRGSRPGATSRSTRVDRGRPRRGARTSRRSRRSSRRCSTATSGSGTASLQEPATSGMLRPRPSRCGGSVAQRSKRCGQRSAKRQPAGDLEGRRDLARNRQQLVLDRAHGRRRAQQRLGVGVRRPGEHRLDRACSTIAPA